MRTKKSEKKKRRTEIYHDLIVEHNGLLCGHLAAFVDGERQQWGLHRAKLWGEITLFEESHASLRANEKNRADDNSYTSFRLYRFPLFLPFNKQKKKNFRTPVTSSIIYWADLSNYLCSFNPILTYNFTYYLYKHRSG